MKTQAHPSGTLGLPLRSSPGAALPQEKQNQLLTIFILILALALGLAPTAAEANVIVPNAPAPNQGIYENSPCITLLEPPPPGPAYLISGYMQYPNFTWPHEVIPGFTLCRRR